MIVYKDKLEIENLLRKNGYRVTKGRVELLAFLKNKKIPLSISDIRRDMARSIDKVTLYRALEDFSKSKIVYKVNLHSTASYYEYIHTDHHHHHIVCEKCGSIEDIANCNQDTLQKNILKHSKSFNTINTHSLEFFGICKKCS